MEMIRSLAARLREFVGNRRRAKRHKVRLACRVSLLEGRGAANGHHQNRRPPELNAHTYDLSSTGVGLVVPAVRVGDQYLAGGSRVLRVVLDLPGSTVQLHVLPTRYERLEEEAGARAFLIGAHILEISVEDRALYLGYLKRLSA